MASVPLGSLLEGLFSQLEQSYIVNVTNGKVLHTWESRTEVTSSDVVAVRTGSALGRDLNSDYVMLLHLLPSLLSLSPSPFPSSFCPSQYLMVATSKEFNDWRLGYKMRRVRGKYGETSKRKDGDKP